MKMENQPGGRSVLRVSSILTLREATGFSRFSKPSILVALRDGRSFLFPYYKLWRHVYYDSNDDTNGFGWFPV